MMEIYNQRKRKNKQKQTNKKPRKQEERNKRNERNKVQPRKLWILSCLLRVGKESHSHITTSFGASTCLGCLLSENGAK